MDARSLCFASLFTFPLDEALLKQAADAGYAFAQEKMSEVYSRKRESLHLAFHLATLAAAQGDRDGFARVAHLYRTQQGCIYDEKALVEN
jgi:TPR repeat protein